MRRPSGRRRGEAGSDIEVTSTVLDAFGRRMSATRWQGRSNAVLSLVENIGQRCGAVCEC
jgi:hypothetical protein